MDVTVGVGLSIAGYAAFSLAALVLAVVVRRGGLSEVAREETAAVGFVATYAQGLRGAIWAAAAVLYAMAAALVFARVADALYIYVAALCLDFALFLSWSQRRVYVAHLTPTMRFSEAATVFFLAGTAVVLWLMRAAGVLQ